ncbi:hypothetical protein MKW94_015634 [Papaver nudicaule]|uniref:Myb-like domain-containing protein n=1 Tax=Papaver nudicaule TaxID=74823 RepID=A0AA41RXI2_PAPNU|nr:hypothetical protein [Papaver nudicaule]
MLEMSSLIGNSGAGAANATSTTGGNNESGSMNVDFAENERLRSTGSLNEDGDRNSSGGSRWPRQETMALLKIRSDMDVIFRDSTLKGPLWEEVSRKLADLGYHRNAKKCKEKFENVYKYHKRTKDGRSTKQDGKTYRFFDQLEALENQFPSSSLPLFPSEIKTNNNQASSLPAAATLTAPTNPILVTNNSPQPTTTTTTTVVTSTTTIPSALPSITTTEFMTSPSTSSSTFSLGGEDSEGTPTQSKKRKFTVFFENLMKEVIQKQEMLQKEFMEAIEKHEHQHMVREEQWKMQELARINREHEILIQERSIAAAKDAAVIAFLQKMSSSTSQPMPSSDNQIVPVPLQENKALQPEKIVDSPPIRSSDNNNNNASKDENNFLPRISSSRWPKVEIEALIKMRTDLEVKYQDNGPKGPLWEEVSTGMKKLGYNRNAKRCKEKWENINKYYKKVKESNKKRPEDSKTCPYFDQLEELYKEKNSRRGLLHNNPSSEQQQQQQKQEKEQEQDLDQTVDMDGDEDEGEDGYEVVRKTSMGTVD